MFLLSFLKFHLFKLSIYEIYVFIVLLILVLLYLLYLYRENKVTFIQAVSSVLLFTYLSLVLAITVFTRGVTAKNYELVLFWSWREVFAGDRVLLTQNILNIFLLFPAGMFFSLIKIIRFRRVFLYGLGISVSIELLQLILKRGLFEFDDMVHNSFGFLLGYWLMRYMKRWME